MKRTRSFWPFIGFIFVSVIGTLLHFLYDWLGQRAVVGLLSAVNESVWEHMKLLYVPLMLFAVIQRRFSVNREDGFWCVKLRSILVGLTVIPTLYYTYTGVLGVSADWFNIAIFFISAALAFWVEARLMDEDVTCRIPQSVAIAILVVIGILFVIFTFLPPHIPLFEDPLDGSYGI